MARTPDAIAVHGPKSEVIDELLGYLVAWIAHEAKSGVATNAILQTLYAELPDDTLRLGRAALLWSAC